MKRFAGLLAVLVGLCWISTSSTATDGVSDAEVVALVEALEQARSAGAVTGLKSEGWDQLSAAMLDAVQSGTSGREDAREMLDEILGPLLAELLMAHGKLVVSALEPLGLPATTDLQGLLDSGDGEALSSAACIGALLTAQGLAIEAMAVCQRESAVACAAAIVRAVLAHAHAQSVCGHYLEQH